MNSPAAQESITTGATITPSRRGAVIFKCTLGLFLILMGTVGTAALWIAYQRAAETRSWTPMDCVIVASQMLTERESPHSPITYRADVRYRYRVNGVSHTGTHVQRTDGPNNDRGKVAKIIEAHAVGTTATCYVNPQHPELAVLEHSTLAPLYSLWFPLLFVVGGAGMVVSAFRAPRKQR